jgi:hypothetical protein
VWHLFSPCCPYVFDSKENKREEGHYLAYNTLFGITIMKRHVEFEHLKLLTTFVEKIVTIYNISMSQTMDASEGFKAM